MFAQFFSMNFSELTSEGGESERIFTVEISRLSNCLFELFQSELKTLNYCTLMRDTNKFIMKRKLIINRMIDIVFLIKHISHFYIIFQFLVSIHFWDICIYYFCIYKKITSLSLLFLLGRIPFVTYTWNSHKDRLQT
jgi:hypothetical protein